MRYKPNVTVVFPNMSFYYPTASLCFNRTIKRVDWPYIKHDNVFFSHCRVGKMNDSGMGDWMGYFLHACVRKEQGNSTLSYPEWLWYNSGNEATLDFHKEVMIEERYYTEVGDMRLNWEDISSFVEIFTSCTQTKKNDTTSKFLLIKKKIICRRTKARVFQPVPRPSLPFHTLAFCANT